MKKIDNIQELISSIIFTWIIISLVVGLISAETIFAGEELIIPIDYKIINCSVTNSSYNLKGLNLSWYENNIIISTNPLYKPDNLTISCWVIKGKEVIKKDYPNGGSGGHCRIKKDFNWNCSEWSECINETQQRLCKEKNNCGNTYGKPIENRSCLIINNGKEIIDIEPSIKEKLTWFQKFWNWIKSVFLNIN